MSASPCHIDSKGSLHVLAHDLQQLHSHEANYPPFWLEMANVLYGMDAVDEYLRGTPFRLNLENPNLSFRTYTRRPWLHSGRLLWSTNS